MANEPIDSKDWEPLAPDLANNLFGFDAISDQLAEVISELNRQSNQLQQLVSYLKPPYGRLCSRQFWAIAVLDGCAMATDCIVSLATGTYSVVLTLIPLLLTGALVYPRYSAARAGASSQEEDDRGATNRPEPILKQIDVVAADCRDTAQDDTIAKPADDKPARP